MSKMWKDMTPEEKGALLLAHHEGKGIELWVEEKSAWFVAKYPSWTDYIAYRVKPEPEVKTITIYTGWIESGGWDEEQLHGDTHKITLNLIDGEPDFNSVKMEKL